MRTGMRVVLLSMLSLLFASYGVAGGVQPTKIEVRGVELHYIEQGEGEPLILLHGGQGDYRSWGPQMEAFSRRYRVISYSRRFNYPNQNPLIDNYRSSFTEAEDLAEFIRTLELGRVHLVGTSIGASTALVLAVDHPEMIRSLVLVEPPVLRWAKDDPLGGPLYKNFMVTLWQPATAAFKAGDDREAMRVLVDGFAGAGKFEALSPNAQLVAMQNSRFFKAATAARDPFPDLAKERVKRLQVPALIVQGEHTLEIHKFVNEELARLLPRAKRVTISRAGHGSARENPEAFNAAVLEFLAQQKP